MLPQGFTRQYYPYGGSFFMTIASIRIIVRTEHFRNNFQCLVPNILGNIELMEIYFGLDMVAFLIGKGALFSPINQPFLLAARQEKNLQTFRNISRRNLSVRHPALRQVFFLFGTEKEQMRPHSPRKCCHYKLQTFENQRHFKGHYDMAAITRPLKVKTMYFFSDSKVLLS